MIGERKGIMKAQAGASFKIKNNTLPLHFTNPYLDAAVELSPLGDARDIYEGISGGDYLLAVQGLVGLGGTAFGISFIPKLLKLRKLNKAMKLANNSLDRYKYYNERKKLIPRVTSTAAGGGYDLINDIKSIINANTK